MQSPFTPQECARRLKEATEPDRGGLYEDLDRSPAVLARLRGSRIRLRVRRPFTRNALAPIFYGRFEPINDGALIHGKFRTHPAVVAFLVVWFAVVLLPGVWMLVDALGSTTGPDQGVSGLILVPAFLSVVSALLLWFIKRMSRTECADIMHVIARTLETTTQGKAATDER